MPVCQTPCVVDLPPGSHKIRLQPLWPQPKRSEAMDIEVTATPTVYRRAVGNVPSTGHAALSYVLPVALLLPGLLFGSIGAANLVRSMDAVGERADRLETSGTGLAVLGGALLVSEAHRIEAARKAETARLARFSESLASFTSGLSSSIPQGHARKAKFDSRRLVDVCRGRARGEDHHRKRVRWSAGRRTPYAGDASPRRPQAPTRRRPRTTQRDRPATSVRAAR